LEAEVARLWAFNVRFERHVDGRALLLAVAPDDGRGAGEAKVDQQDFARPALVEDIVGLDVAVRDTCFQVSGGKGPYGRQRQPGPAAWQLASAARRRMTSERMSMGFSTGPLLLTKWRSVLCAGASSNQSSRVTGLCPASWQMPGSPSKRSNYG
jgi:hypothetical protein